MANTVGTNGADVLLGTSGPDTIRGLRGDDLISGTHLDNMATTADGRVIAPAPQLNYFGDDPDVLVGDEGNDRLFGAAGADLLVAGIGQDDLFGGEGADILLGGPGRDFFHFGFLLPGQIPAGSDTYAFGRDVITDFSPGVDKLDMIAYRNPSSPGGQTWIGGDAFDLYNNSLQVRYTYDEADDTIVLFRAPTTPTPYNPSVPFSGQAVMGQFKLVGHFFLNATDFLFQEIDKTALHDLSFADEAQAQMTRLYDSVFQRAPDAQGLTDWVNVLHAGSSLGSVADYFVQSREFLMTYGANLNSEQFVKLLYENVLDRAGEADGVTAWTAVLNGGYLDRGDVVVGFSESAEHTAMIRAGDYLL